MARKACVRFITIAKTSPTHPKIAIFAGSFDPFTLGHHDIVESALKVFDKVLIGIGISPLKKSWLDATDRKTMIQQIYHTEPRVSVKTFEGLLVHFAKDNSAHALVRGLRSEADLAYEFPMSVANRLLVPDIPTYFIPASQGLNYVSSSLVREFVQHGQSPARFVPAAVLDFLKEKFELS